MTNARQSMTTPQKRWARLAGFGVLLALALTCAGALGALDRSLPQQQVALLGLLLLVLLVALYLPHGALPGLVETGRVVPAPPAGFASVFSPLRPTRGPPA